MKVANLGATLLTQSIVLLNKKFFERIFQHFRHDVAVRVIHEVMRFFVFSVAPSSDSGGWEGTIATLSRLDAFLTPTVTCLRVDCSEKAGSHRQKMYSETFSIFVSIALA